MRGSLLESHVAGWPCRRGKVRDVYDVGDALVIVATDRISAFDWVLPTGIPDKGRVLTSMTLFWLDFLGIPNHYLGTDLAPMGPAFAAQAEALQGRTMLVRKTEVVPFECVVRGYLAGSGWKEYRQSGTVCGLTLPAGLRESERLPAPIFTLSDQGRIGTRRKCLVRYDGLRPERRSPENCGSAASISIAGPPLMPRRVAFCWPTPSSSGGNARTAGSSLSTRC